MHEKNILKSFENIEIFCVACLGAAAPLPPSCYATVGAESQISGEMGTFDLCSACGTEWMDEQCLTTTVRWPCADCSAAAAALLGNSGWMRRRLIAGTEPTSSCSVRHRVNSGCGGGGESALNRSAT